MKDTKKHAAAQPAGLVSVIGKLPALKAKNLNRLSIFLTRGNTILGESPVSAKGTFQLHVVPQLASESGVFAVLGPKGMDSQVLASHTNLPRIALSSAKTLENGGVSVDFSSFKITDELIDPWWIWCREYTVSGTLETAGGCPIGAQVTVYNVTSTVSGLVETSIVTVPTDSNGNFTASFNWCSRLCWWPCWPLWWHCWPWWWELDILAVIENLELRLQVQTPGTGIVEFSGVAPLRQPNAADLMTGVGFAASRAGAALKPDSARTALIASKLNNPIIREIFPWWWWCCENPNIVFGASQGTTIILDEDPNTSTRWCFASGQTVSLTGNSQSLGACPIQTSGDCAFAWTAVGGEPPTAVLVENISMGYADGSPGSACSNLAFADSLDLNGLFSGDCVAFYQVLAGQWGGSNGNPARGGTPPVTYQPLSENLVNYVTIWRNGVGPVQYMVNLGPCSFKGFDNLYVTLSQRQTTTTPAAVLTQIGNFPTLGPGDFIMGWAYPDLVLTVPAGDLISPAVTGGANVAIVAFDLTGTPIPSADIDMGPDMTLMIDTTNLTSNTIDWVHVFNADGSPAIQTTSSTSVCPSYQITSGGYALIHTTVVDNAGHLCEYSIQTQYGNGSLPPVVTNPPSGRNYAQAVSTFTPNSAIQVYGVDSGYQVPNDFPPPPPPAQVPAPTNWMFVGGGDITQVLIPESCCYDFQLWVSKRTTNGVDVLCDSWNPAFQTVNITVVP